jgi:SAM-dependent methyltransferase
LERVREYYNTKLQEYGATPAGVDWNSSESQTLRFEQLLKICENTGPLSINDYGCGYGALVDYMVGQHYNFSYTGYDISDQMIAEAKRIHSQYEFCKFFTDESQLTQADYTIASGIFNVKQKSGDREWEAYVLETIRKVARLSLKGFAFNVLTKYSDPDRMRPDLYYADPSMLFDYCKRNFSRFVALLHDYQLYEFTILVKSL